MKKKVLIILTCINLFLCIFILGGNAKVVKASIDDSYVIGTSNFNNTAYNSARLGDRIVLPEIGWRRYDDHNSHITYEGSLSVWDNEASTGDYKNTFKGIYSGTNGKIKFNFSGDKLRIIAHDTCGCWKKDTNHIIEIDGIRYNLSYAHTGKENDGASASRVVFEKLGLSSGIHSVQIIKNGPEIGLDALDIDDNGSLFSFNENTISINKTSLTLDDKEVEKLTASVNGTSYNASNFTWTSSNEAVAKVDAEGNVTGINNGTAVITAKLKNSNLSVSCNVTVNKRVFKFENSNIEAALNKTFDVVLCIDNAIDIQAATADIKFDNSKLQLLDIKCEEGIRFINLVEGNDNIQSALCTRDSKGISGKKKLLRIKFKTVAKGEAFIKVTSGSITDEITMDRCLTEKECGVMKVLVK